MGDSYCLYIIGTLLALSVVAGSEQRESGDNDRIISHIDNIRNGLMALRKTLDTAGMEIEQRAAAQCHGFDGAYCSVSDIRQKIKTQGASTEIGKRSVDSNQLASRDERLFEDLLRKRYILENIKDYLQQASQTLSDERKRSCNLNLGFHCQTEQYSAIADMYNFLQSAMSPGK